MLHGGHRQCPLTASRTGPLFKLAYVCHILSDFHNAHMNCTILAYEIMNQLLCHERGRLFRMILPWLEDKVDTKQLTLDGTSPLVLHKFLFLTIRSLHLGAAKSMQKLCCCGETRLPLEAAQVQHGRITSAVFCAVGICLRVTGS